MSEIITNAKCPGVFVGDRCGNPVPDFDADEQSGPELCDDCKEVAREDARIERGERRRPHEPDNERDLE